MKRTLLQAKPILFFIAKFFFFYFTFSFLYSEYLNYVSSAKKVDFFTEVVAHQVSFVLDLLGYDTQTIPIGHMGCMYFKMNSVYVIRIIEGCNAMSLMILFVSIIFSFGQKVFPIIWFSFVGFFTIHIVNILRLSFLTYLYRYHSSYGHAFHDYIFPLIIYGVVALLWLIFIRYFSFKEKENE